MMMPRRIPALVLGLSAFVLACGRARGDVVAATEDGLWMVLDRMPAHVVAGESWVRPDRYAPVRLDGRVLTGVLERAPMEGAAGAPMALMLPTPEGKFAPFGVVESPVMEAPLQERYPDIRTYLGQGIDDPHASVRLDWTPGGFHAQVLTPEGNWYIDPFTRGETTHYASYYKKDLRPSHAWTCETHGHVERGGFVDAPLGDQLRTYRLACAATGEYTAYHGGTVANGLAAVVTAVNRINGVYEREVAVRLVLVANNNQIIYTSTTGDPYSNFNGGLMLSQNQSNLNAVIGSANYDIGHVFSTGGGGVAYLGCVCNPSHKARGVTGSPAPTGDPFYIDYVAHEMGHQFGAEHSFNSPSSACGGSRWGPSAYEPGSGSTIMAYAGLCNPDNLQNASDAYFGTGSFDEIRGFLVSGGGSTCGAITATGNNYPTVSAGPSYTIPRSTPFALTATATDPDGHPLTYCWEQFDLGPAITLSAGDNGSSPIIRSWAPTAGRVRTIPRLPNLLTNTQAVGEQLPTTTRTLNFRVTARDNRAGGGGIDWASTTINVVGTAGPFAVTSPNTNVSWSGQRTITWNVANTNQPPINTHNVQIRLSTDGGNTFPVVLASSTPNTGSAQVTLPAIFTNQARVKILGMNNIYFDISNTNFTITPGVGPPANNTCATAIPLPLGTTPFNNAGATTSGPEEPICGFCCGDPQLNQDLWYTYTAACTGPTTISLCGSTFNTRLAVYTGAGCPTVPATASRCNDDSCGTQSQVIWNTVAGTVYKVRVGALGGQTGEGTITVSCGVCYANCDESTTPPILNVDDFTCFVSKFAVAGSLPHAQQVTHYANCDESTVAPVLNVDDFTCFISRFAAGCP